jgi:hypothetical protein
VDVDLDPITFGDNVRIRSAPDTEKAGLSGLLGQVYGHTTPSVTGVEVIGPFSIDLAINVHFAERGESFWFAPQLVEFVDHAAGTEIEIGVGPSAARFVRDSSGEWVKTETHEGGLFQRLLRGFRRSK